MARKLNLILKAIYDNNGELATKQIAEQIGMEISCCGHCCRLLVRWQLLKTRKEMTRQGRHWHIVRYWWLNPKKIDFIITKINSLDESKNVS